MKTNFLPFSKHVIVLFIFILSLGFTKCVAHNITGCDISYQCTSTQGVYKVTMKVYRDCSFLGICPGCTITPGNLNACTTNSAGWSTQIVGLSSSCAGVNLGGFILTAVSSPGVYDIIKTCNTVSTNCTNCNTRTAGTFSPGIEVYTFEGNVNLNSIPTTCCRIIFSANTCCRAFLSTNSYGGSIQAVCELDRCQTDCNSAPIFTNEATALVCAGADFVYNLGAIDIDGDSLSYAFGQPLQGINSPSQYISPFNVNYPFPYFGAPNANAALPAGLHINSQTGDIMFRPSGIFTSMLVIEVTQWKLIGGIRVNVGKTRRDLQFQTVLCVNNKTPIIKVFNNGVLQSNNLTAFARQQICLDIVAEDLPVTSNNPLTADTTDLSWNNAGLINTYLANATFTRNYILANRATNGPKADSFKFCWTPPTNAIRQLPHLFTVTGTDRFCPLKAFATKGISLVVQNPFVNIETSTKNVFCNNKITNTSINYKVNGINLLSNNVFTVQLSDSLGSFTNATSLATSTSSLLIGSIMVNIPLGLALNKSYSIRVLCSSDSLCDNIVYPISIIQGFTQPIISSNRNSFCKDVNALISAVPVVAGLSYKWYRNNILLSNETSSSFSTDSSSIYKVIVSNAGCSDSSNSLTLVVYPKPKAAFTCPDTICKSDLYNFVVITNNSSVDYGTIGSNWTFSDGTIDNVSNPVKTLLNNNNLTIKLIITSNNNCVDSLNKTVIINQKPNSNFISNTNIQCKNNNIFMFLHDSIAGNTYSWDFGDSTFSSFASPKKTYSKIGTYTVSLIELNTSGCSDTTIKTVNVYPNPMASFQYMSAREQCLKTNNFVFSNNSTIENGTMSYKWVMGENDTIIQQNSSKTFNKKGRYDIYLFCTSNHNCTDLRMNDVTVYDPKIDSIIGNKNPNISLLPYTYSVRNQPSVLFDWTITNGVIISGQGTNSVNVIWSSTGTGLLKARINEAFTCYDSTYLTVNITNVGINSLSLENDLTVYPNPTENFITISNKNNLVSKNYIITNLVGQTVISGKLNLGETIVNLETLQSGMYFLSLDGLSKQSIKIVKE